MNKLPTKAWLTCAGCGAHFEAYAHPGRRRSRCQACFKSNFELREKPQRMAASVVALAVKLGELEKVTSLTCVDCGAKAKHYEHRDYSLPLDVQPTCVPCNMKRGPARIESVAHVRSACLDAVSRLRRRNPRDEKE